MIFLRLYLAGLPLSLVIYASVFAYKVFPYMEQSGYPLKWGYFERGIWAQKCNCPHGEETMDEEEWFLFFTLGTLLWPAIWAFFLIKGALKGSIIALVGIYKITKGAQ